MIWNTVVTRYTFNSSATRRKKNKVNRKRRERESLFLICKELIISKAKLLALL